jgi:hypothetical protein
MGKIAAKLVETIRDLNNELSEITFDIVDYNTETRDYLNENPIRSPAFFEAREKKAAELEKKKKALELKLKVAFKAAAVVGAPTRAGRALKDLKAKIKKYVEQSV